MAKLHNTETAEQAFRQALSRVFDYHMREYKTSQVLNPQTAKARITNMLATLEQCRLRSELIERRDTRRLVQKNVGMAHIFATQAQNETSTDNVSRCYKMVLMRITRVTELLCS